MAPTSREQDISLGRTVLDRTMASIVMRKSAGRRRRGRVALINADISTTSQLTTSTSIAAAQSTGFHLASSFPSSTLDVEAQVPLTSGLSSSSSTLSTSVSSSGPSNVTPTTTSTLSVHNVVTTTPLITQTAVTTYIMSAQTSILADIPPGISHTSLPPSGHHGLDPAMQDIFIILGGVAFLIFVTVTLFFVSRLKNTRICCCGARARENQRVRNILDMDRPPRYSSHRPFYSYKVDKKRISLQELPDNSYYAALDKKPELAKTTSKVTSAAVPVPQKPLPTHPKQSLVQPRQPARNLALETANNIGISFTNTMESTPMSAISTTDPHFQTMLSRQAHDPTQKYANHLSDLSSLSSGFGDGLRISINTTPNGDAAAGSQLSPPPVRKFSWVRDSMRGSVNTVYTRSSVESAPRFRSINSWVSQQAGRLSGQRQSDQESLLQPEVPTPYAAPQQYVQQNGPFRTVFHPQPGEGMQISRGSGVIFQNRTSS